MFISGTNNHSVALSKYNFSFYNIPVNLGSVTIYPTKRSIKDI